MMVVYITTNLINGKKYIGLDSNNDPLYLGSGVFMKKAIKKHGKENFKKEILEECETWKDLMKCEKKWIKHYNAVKDKNFYNLRDGGQGGDITQFMTEERIQEWKDNISKGKKGQRKGIKFPKSRRDNISKGIRKFYENGGVSTNTGPSKETAKKISIANKGVKKTVKHKKNLKKAFKKRDYNGDKNPYFGMGYKQSGDKNAMYGKSYYDVWLEKYGKKEADKRMREYKKRAAAKGNKKLAKIIKKVISFLKKKKKIISKDYANMFDVHMATASYMLKKLVKNNILIKNNIQGTTNFIVYELKKKK